MDAPEFGVPLQGGEHSLKLEGGSSFCNVVSGKKTIFIKMTCMIV